MRFLDGQNRLCRLAFGLRLDTRTYPFIPPATVDWYDIDLHDVIALRRRLFELRAGLHVVGVSVTDPQLLGGIAGDREILVVAEGLTPYLRRTDGLAMLRRIVGHFESGEMLLDGFSRAGVWLLQRHPPVKASGAQLDWSIGARASWNGPYRGWCSCEWWFADAEEIRRFYSSRYWWLMQLLFRLTPVRRLGRGLRYHFGSGVDTMSAR